MDTILDYTYDVNYSVQKGECLKLGMWLPLSYCMEYEDHMGASNTIPFEMESVDIDGEGRIYHTSASGFKYDCYLKDHLGSTRMVVNDEDVVTEAFAYQPYGTIIPLEDIAATPQTPTWQQFTGKEFDQEGAVEGVTDGISAYHLPARMYDPEIGIWFRPDPLGQYWNGYSYTGGNPVMLVDPNGMWSWRKFLNVMYSIVNPVAYFERASSSDEWDPSRDYDSYFFGWKWGDKSGPVIGDPEQPGGTVDVDLSSRKSKNDESKKGPQFKNAQNNSASNDLGWLFMPAGYTAPSGLSFGELGLTLGRSAGDYEAMLLTHSYNWQYRPRDCLAFGISFAGADNNTVESFYNNGSPWAPSQVDGKLDWSPLNRVINSSWMAQTTIRDPDRPYLAIGSNTPTFKTGHSGIRLQNMFYNSGYNRSSSRHEVFESQWRGPWGFKRQYKYWLFWELDL